MEKDITSQTKDMQVVARSPWAMSAIILAWSLAIVFLYFGINEVLSPQDWIVFVPNIFGTGSFIISLVVAHGILLTVLGAALILNFHRNIVAAIAALFLLEIAASLIFQAGFSDVAVRDIGLFGAAIALYFMPTK